MSVYKPLPKEIFEHYEIYFFDIEKASDVRNLISRMWEENQQLKEREKMITERYNVQRQYAIEMEGRVVNLQSVLNEVREHCECMIKIYGRLTKKQQQEELQKFLPYDKILTILDKVGGSNE